MNRIDVPAITNDERRVSIIEHQGKRLDFSNGCHLHNSEEHGLIWGCDPYGSDWACNAGDNQVESILEWLAYWDEPRDETGSLLDLDAADGNEHEGEPHAQASPQSPLYPAVAELWEYAGRVAVITGNLPDDEKPLWVMCWDTGESTHAPLTSLKLRDDRFSVSYLHLAERFELWARAGNADAMWFLGWWYEVINHQRSTWYYIAAIRAAPNQYVWALARVIDDARSPGTRLSSHDDSTIEYPYPNLDFLSQIPEITERKLQIDQWAVAVAAAESSPNTAPLING